MVCLFTVTDQHIVLSFYLPGPELLFCVCCRYVHRSLVCACVRAYVRACMCVRMCVPYLQYLKTVCILGVMAVWDFLAKI